MMDLLDLCSTFPHNSSKWGAVEVWEGWFVERATHTALCNLDCDVCRHRGGVFES